MRLKLQYAVLIVGISFIPSLGYGTESSKPPSHRLHTVAANDAQIGVRPNPIIEDARDATNRRQTSNGTSQVTIGDLFLSSRASTKPTKKISDSINVEPWVPGRGSLGVKVEITW